MHCLMMQEMIEMSEQTAVLKLFDFLLKLKLISPCRLKLWTYLIKLTSTNYAIVVWILQMI